MGFLHVDKNKRNKKGTVYVASIEGYGIIIGTLVRKTKIRDIMMAVSEKYAGKRRMPAIELLLNKKCGNIIKEEARVNAELFEYYDRDKKYLKVGIDTIKEVWNG